MQVATNLLPVSETEAKFTVVSMWVVLKSVIKTAQKYRTLNLQLNVIYVQTLYLNMILIYLRFTWLLLLWANLNVNTTRFTFTTKHYLNYLILHLLSWELWLHAKTVLDLQYFPSPVSHRWVSQIHNEWKDPSELINLGLAEINYFPLLVLQLEKDQVCVIMSQNYGRCWSYICFDDISNIWGI